MAVALTTLWVLSAFLVMWGGSLVYRGVFVRERRSERLWCPSCRGAVEGLVCGSCGYEGESRRDFVPPRNWRLVIGSVVPIVGGIASGYVAEVVRGWFGRSYARGGVGLHPVQGAALGVLLFAAVLGLWSWRGDRSRGRRRCPKCWYDMSASNLSCPECGHEAGSVKRLYRARRRWRGVAGAAALAVVAYGMWVTPRTLAGGAAGVMPSWVLIAGLPWLPEWMVMPRPMAGRDDWTLHGRWQERRLWALERWLLQRRARGVVAGEPRGRVLARVMHYMTAQDQSLAVPAHRAMVRGLVSPNAKERSAAATAHLWFRVDDGVRRAIEPRTEALFGVLDDPDPAVRSYAAWYLGEIGVDAARLYRGVLDSVRKSSAPPSMRSLALSTNAEGAADLVLEASREENANVRRACAQLLYGMRWHGTRPEAATRRLIEMLEDGDGMVAQAAADSLAIGGPEADTVVPALLRWWIGRGGTRLRFPVELADGYEAVVGNHMQIVAELLAADPGNGVYLIEQMMRTQGYLRGHYTLEFGAVRPGLKGIAEGADQGLASRAGRLLQAIEARQK